MTEDRNGCIARRKILGDISIFAPGYRLRRIQRDSQSGFVVAKPSRAGKLE
jgi:hypothetical protein